MSHTGFVFDPLYLEHKAAMHPECPERLERIMAKIKETKILDHLQNIPPRPAAVEEITLVHDYRYVEKVKETCARGGGYLDPDTYTSRQSYDAALLAAGGALAAVDAVMAGNIKNIFALIRPPGHHALPERAMGFCLFNNIAITARYLESKYSLKKILIIDWDVHHGNGTEHIFYNESKVLYFSTHQSWFYPGTGWAEAVGQGEGEGFTVNVPLKSGTGDQEYEAVFRQILYPIAMAYQPEFILISAGQDAHHSDPIGGMYLTTRGYEKMTAIVKEIAQRCCNERIVILLEGGYNLEGQAQSVAAVFNTLAQLNFDVHEKIYPQNTVSSGFINDLNEVKKIQSKYWKLYD
ncbi:MAG TPA: histone deacetylase [Desulfotomaculum sp.]|nr:histone deacetylase [Desulfotomaculum sp.]